MVGAVGFGNWMWDGILGGLKWAGEVFLHLLKVAGVGELLQMLWGLFARMRPLTGDEIKASQSVSPAASSPTARSGSTRTPT